MSMNENNTILSLANKLTGKHILLGLAAVTFMLLACDRRLCVKEYTLEASGITSPVRIALITDLHNSKYGKNQCQLLDAIHKQSPDLILLGGDLFDDSDAHPHTEQFLSGIAGKYPCYYVTGNHEHRHGPDSFAIRMGILEKYNIPVLSGSFETISVNGQTVSICGVDDPMAIMSNSGEPLVPFEEQLRAVSAAAETDGCTVLLSHRPEYFETYCGYDFDLVLCGHAHGGQWRIPLLLNGLYAPQQGLFPKYAGGLYRENGTAMIVSRGLCRGKSFIPRIFNRPEVVIIDLV